MLYLADNLYITKSPCDIKIYKSYTIFSHNQRGLQLSYNFINLPSVVSGTLGAVTYSFSADGNIPTSSIIIMPYGHIQTMNINIIKPSQLNNQLNIDQNVNKVDDPYGFLINLVNNLNTANQ